MAVYELVKSKIPQELIGYFREDEPIWVMTNNLTEKQDIEDGFNRETVAIRTIDDLLIQAENALKNGNPHASLVVTASLPSELEMNISQVIAAVNLMPNVKVYEINRDVIFQSSIELATIRQLIVLSKERTRSSQIEQYADPSDKQASLLRSLEEDLIIARSDLDNAKKQIEIEKKEKGEIALKLKELAQEIKLKYLPEANKYKKLSEQLQRSLSDTQILLDKEQEKSKQYMHEKDSANSDVINLRYDIEARDRTIKTRDEQIERLRMEIERLKDEISDTIRERDAALESVVEAEQTLLLKEELTKERTKSRVITSDLDNARIDLSGKSLEILDLQRQIAILRKGNQAIKTLGRTNLLDAQVLDRADLVYIKVIDNLPYHRLATKMLFDLLDRKYNGNALMVIIKNDEGLDTTKFKGINIIGDLTELGVDDKIVRLFPSSNMLTGIRNAEKDIQLFVVVDYIQSSNYYLDTKSRSHFMTMVQNIETIKEVTGLKGSPLSFGNKSIFDLSYDQAIGTSAFQENRHDMLLYKVHTWMGKLNIIN